TKRSNAPWSPSTRAPGAHWLFAPTRWHCATTAAAGPRAASAFIAAPSDPRHNRSTAEPALRILEMLAPPQRELLRGHRPCEQETLHLAASGVLQEGQLRLGLHALGDDAQTHGVRQPDDGVDDGRVVGIDHHVAHEALVDLERVDGQPLEVGQRRIARAEVVDRHAYAHRADLT